ncbi:unnamed protein product, partial [Ectocarpus sp. 13 AM-2016]
MGGRPRPHLSTDIGEPGLAGGDVDDCPYQRSRARVRLYADDSDPPIGRGCGTAPSQSQPRCGCGRSRSSSSSRGRGRGRGTSKRDVHEVRGFCVSLSSDFDERRQVCGVPTNSKRSDGLHDDGGGKQRHLHPVHGPFQPAGAGAAAVAVPGALHARAVHHAGLQGDG